MRKDRGYIMPGRNVMSRIVVVTHAYPSAAKPNNCPFVEELVETWRGQGVDVHVIKPVILSEYLQLLLKGQTKKGKNLYPLYFDYTFLRFFRFIPAIRRLHIRIADKSFQKTVEKKLKLGKDDILYSHFLDSGFCVAALSEKYHIPSYCAVGESTLWTLEFKNMNEVRRRMDFISGFIAVSSKNKQMLLDHALAAEEKVRIFPNGVNLDKIHKLNKAECRKALNIDENQVVGVFLGHFIERKGPLRVAKATDGIEGLKMMYIGKGDQEPEGDNIIFKGMVPHDEVVKYLSAADFFVLPTQAEGCCNAIIEAMACGLPVISSNSDFNDDILDADCSVRIDPNDIDQLRNAVKRMAADGDLRRVMSEAALKKAASLSLQDRAANILRFIGYQQAG